MGRYTAALRRLGVDEVASDFYEDHIEADGDHERIVITSLVRNLIADEPRLVADVHFGTRALDCVEATFARRLSDTWSTRRSSLHSVD